MEYDGATDESILEEMSGEGSGEGKVEYEAWAREKGRAEERRCVYV